MRFSKDIFGFHRLTLSLAICSVVQKPLNSRLLLNYPSNLLVFKSLLLLLLKLFRARGWRSRGRRRRTGTEEGRGTTSPSHGSGWSSKWFLPWEQRRPSHGGEYGSSSRCTGQKRILHPPSSPIQPENMRKNGGNRAGAAAMNKKRERIRRWRTYSGKVSDGE